MNKDHLLFVIGRINYKINRFLVRELKKHQINGIAPSHGEILGSLMMRGQIQMKEVVDIIDKDKSTVTALIDKLVSMGYVDKTKDAVDNRVSIIRLTEKGEALKPEVMEISEKLRAKAYKNISEEEKEILNTLLRKLNANL